MADHLVPETKQKTILIVDDDAKIRTLLREILSLLPYRILEAENGKQGLETIHKEAVDLVITDRSMPGMDGLEMVKQLRAENVQVPVLMISSYGDEALWASAIGLGVEDYVLKPFSSESVLNIVNKKLQDETS